MSIDNFKKYNIFVGDNSSCKTTIMEAIYSSLPNIYVGIITTANSRGMQVRLDNIHNFFYNANTNKEIQFILDDKIVTKILFADEIEDGIHHLNYSKFCENLIKIT